MNLLKFIWSTSFIKAIRSIRLLKFIWSTSFIKAIRSIRLLKFISRFIRAIRSRSLRFINRFINAVKQKKNTIIRRCSFSFSAEESKCLITYLHVLPNSLLLKPQSHGSSKDILHIQGALESEGMNAHRVYIDRDIGGAIALVRFFKSRQYSTKYEFILYNIPGSNFSTLLVIKIFSDNIRIFFRSHNAEFLHRIETGLACDGYPRIRNFCLAFKRLFSDYFISLIVYRILAISRSDIQSYWRYLTKKTDYLPYLSGDASCDISRNYKYSNLSKNKIISLGTVIRKGEIALKQELKFYEYVRSLPEDISRRYDFFQTASQAIDLAPAHVTCLPVAESLNDLFRGSSALVIATSEGRGAKTKVVDAIISGLPVIMPYSLLAKLDVEYHQSVIPFEDNDEVSFSKALLSLETFDYKISKDNGAVINLMMRRVINNFAEKMSSKPRQPSHLAVLTVFYTDHINFLAHFKYMAQQSPGLQINLYLVLNNNLSDIEALNKELCAVNLPKNIRIRQIVGLGVPSILSKEFKFYKNIGSYRHAAALHIGLTSINFNEYEQVLVIDPDFIVLSKNGLHKLVENLHQQLQVDAINNIYTPAFLTHNLKNICAQFFLFKTSRFSKSELDFTPDLEHLPKNNRVNKWLQKNKDYFNNNLFLSKFFDTIYLIKIRNTSRDTGWRINGLREHRLIQRMAFGENRDIIKLNLILQSNLFLRWLLNFDKSRADLIRDGAQYSIGKDTSFGEFHVQLVKEDPRFYKKLKIFSLHTRSRPFNMDLIDLALCKTEGLKKYRKHEKEYDKENEKIR
jgi:hypothetical protein